MPLTEKSGFFSEYYLNLKNTQGENFDKEVAKIAACRNDFERISFVEQLAFVREHDEMLQVRREFLGKSAETAALLKEKGNMAFKEKQWLEAMVLYTKAYVALTEDKVAERAIILANRSATLYHMEKYDETLIDAKRAMDLGYPQDLIYKLHERQARCYMAKEDYPNTISSFKKFVSALDGSKAPVNKSGKMYLDAMTMIRMLEKDPRTAKQSEKQDKLNNGMPTLSIPIEKEFISSSIRIDQNKEEGRFARAATDIKVGEEILVQQPYVAVLLQKYAKTHCEYCFIRTAIPVACARCTDVVFCSDQCLERANNGFHKYECGILPTIRRSGVSVNCHMVLRIIASKPLASFLRIKDEIDKELPIAEAQKLPNDDYRRVSHLERHLETRTSSNYFQHALMARFLTKCLEETGYFAESTQATKPDDVQVIASIMLRSLQFIQFNTHEVSELQKMRADDSEKTVFIGGALYPTLALFNHSCDPGVVRYFRGTTIHVNTVKPIEAGLQISENYGPIYTRAPREERQSQLKELYCFDCSCDACLENWPTFEQLPTDVIRFRCDAPNKCSSIIEVHATCNDFMVKCVDCGECTNIFKGLKVMQDTELMTRTAKRFYETGDFSKALQKFIDLLKIMYEVLAPPFPDFCQCQQHMRDCFLHFGNFYRLD